MGEVVSLNGKAKLPAWIDAVALVGESEVDREWVINDLIERQGRILLAGAEGAGKSLLALTAAVQAAANLNVLGRFGTDLPATVVYIDLEMARSSTRRRLRELSATAKLPDGALYVLHRPDGLDVSSNRERRDLFALLDEVEPTLIVVDPLYKFMLTDSVYERDVRPTIQALDEMRVRYNASLILVHHLRKRAHGEANRGKDSSDIFGSSVLLRWPEVILTMAGDDVLRVVKDRDDTFHGIKSFPIKRGGAWPLSLENPSLTREEEIAQWLRSHGPASGNSVFAGVGGNKTAVLASLTKLDHTGAIRRDKDGLWEVSSW